MAPRARAIKKIADEDTPEHVQVPESYIGIAMWALGRFGIGIIFIYSTWLLYGDQKVLNQQILNFQIERLKVDLEMTRTMSSLRDAVISVGNEAKVAHDKKLYDEQHRK